MPREVDLFGSYFYFFFHELSRMNYRGEGSSNFLRIIKFYIQNYNPACIALLETKCHINRAKKIFKSLGFDNFICQKGVGGVGVFGLLRDLIFLLSFLISVIIISYIYKYNWTI